MKTNAIIRIILLSLAILAMAGILIVGITIDTFIFDDDSFHEGLLPVAQDGENGICVADASTIRNIGIEWAAGSITILPDANAVNITVTETYPKGSGKPMHCQQAGDTLTVQFAEDSVSFPSFGVSSDASKDLLITVPAGWNCVNLEIDAASADVQVGGLSIQKVDFDGASGTCHFEECQVDTLDLDTASGDVTFSGSLNILECDAVSANVQGVLDNAPSRLDFEGVSGDLDITLPDDCGFCVNLDSISGNFTTDFPITSSDGKHYHGDGSCKISADGVSGNINIRKGGYCVNESTQSVDAVCTDESCTDTSHGHSIACTDANCTNESHDHAGVCSDSSCTDESHGHSIACTEPDCTDESHGHSTTHSEKESDSAHHSSKHHS